MLRRTFLTVFLTVAAGLTLAGPPTYYPPAIGDFDGAADYLSRGSDLTGLADSKTGILSLWMRIDGGDGETRYILRNNIHHFYLNLTTGNTFQVMGKDAVPAVKLQLTSTSTYTASASWLHVLVAYDMASASHFYIDDIDIKNELALVDAALDLTPAGWTIADIAGGSVSPFNGAISELYFAPNQYLDFSIETNRRLFIDESGYPVDLGPSGYKPTGTAPLVYMRTQFNNCGLNSGTGGDFVIQGAPAYTVGPVPFPHTTWAPGQSRGRGGRGGRSRIK